ncbi:Glucan endo-1 [Escovopsis weberi]|uniref:Glucan endo-1 n=1 Tax=Escovopsis weberi TaxID=150374 RepID=A0A0M8N3J2_ESCWE|nr:Glucan endo-1 [Escovopsis weberi]
MLTTLRRLGVGLLAATAALSGVAVASSPHGLVTRSLDERAAAGDRLVFCHFMIGIVSDRTSPDDYDADMQLAKSVGIDAFALNIGTDSYTITQLQYAYQSAAKNDMKVFISFDFNWYSTSQGTAVGQMVQQFASMPAQLMVNGKAFVSSFAGDGVDVNAIRAAAGVPITFVPNWHPELSDPSSIDGALNWAAWDSNGRNKAPDNTGDVTVAQGDAAYIEWLQGKIYVAPLSAWFSTHFGPEVSFSKNFVFPSGLLWFNRWQQVLEQGFEAVEIVTWNDYGESHYVGPLSSPHTDDGSSKWANDQPHDGWLDLATPFIAAYKNKDTNVANYITADKIVYWYRRNLNSINCDATDTTFGRPADNSSGNYFEGRPNGWETMPDEVYVAALLKTAGTVTVVSGGQSSSFDLPAGASAFSVPANLGHQAFSLSRGGSTVMSSTSLMDITNICPCGLYNYNAYVGTVPAGFSDPLQPDGLASLTVGLRVTTCLPTPSLGLNPAVSGIASTPGPASPSSTTTTSKANSSPSTTALNPGPTPTGTCNGGTVAEGESGNFTGLCNFACAAGYCPPGPCVCTSFGTPSTPASNGRNGCPLSGEPDAYLGLCSFTCNHGYCPDSACQYC